MCVEGSSKYYHCPDPIDSWNPSYHMETPPPQCIKWQAVRWPLKARLSRHERNDGAKQYIYIY